MRAASVAEQQMIGAMAAHFAGQPPAERRPLWQERDEIGTPKRWDYYPPIPGVQDVAVS